MKQPGQGSARVVRARRPGGWFAGEVELTSPDPAEQVDEDARFMREAGLTVARIGCPCAPKTSQKTPGHPA